MLYDVHSRSFLHKYGFSNADHEFSNVPLIGVEHVRSSVWSLKLVFEDLYRFEIPILAFQQAWQTRGQTETQLSSKETSLS